MKFFLPVAEDAKLLKGATKPSKSSMKSRSAGQYRTLAITRSVTATMTKTYMLASENLNR
jgi:hypothetical protein